MQRQTNVRHHREWYVRQWWRTLLWLMMGIGIVACTDATPTYTPAPTLTLIPVTATFTPTPIPSTATRVNLPEPGDLKATSPAETSLIAILVTDSRPNKTLFEAMRTDLATSLPADTTIRLGLVEPAAWLNPRMACSQRRFPKAESIVEGYRYTLLANERLYIYHANRDGHIRRCAENLPLTGELLMALDPAASELVSLAKQRLATDLNIASRRVELEDVQAYTWRDSSLGCPQSERGYNAVAIDGYRILLAAGERTYLYHTDASTLFVCNPEQEVLPPD